MAMNNHPDKIVLDAYSDTGLELQNPNGVYSRFTNRLTTPILNAKGLILLNANFVNPIMQLNDASQLMFFYYTASNGTPQTDVANLACVRLLPSNFVPATSFTAYTQNKYFNTVAELVAALNVAAASGGDDVTYNPLWIADRITFAYDSATRRISINCPSYNAAPAAADDPNVLACLAGTSTRGAGTIIKMKNYGATSYGTATAQPYVNTISMNARLGFAMSYYSRGLWWGSTGTTGCATSTGVAQNATAIVADANPILIGSQNVNVYTSVTTGGGIDSLNRKNLLATIPLEAPALNVNSYTMSSVEKPSLSTPDEIYEITVEFRDDYGIPVPFPPNYNAELQIAIFY
jgi:hypothetical protein